MIPLFCRHRWAVAVRTVAAPLRFHGRFTISGDIAERLLCGVVTVLLTCDKCGDTHTEEMLGVEHKG